MHQNWFDIPPWIRQNPDFLPLSDEAIELLKNNKTWVEWKILRQYQMLFDESVKILREVAYHISMNTRKMGEAAAIREDLPALDLMLKFFNTYLRSSINANEIRTVYNVLFQYRQLGEFIVKKAMEIPERDLTIEHPLEARAVRVAKFMRYYASICLQKNLFFLVEVIAHDIRVLCETAFRERR